MFFASVHNFRNAVLFCNGISECLVANHGIRDRDATIFVSVVFFHLLLLIDKKWSFRKCAGFGSAFPFHIPPWFVCIYSAFGLLLFIFIFKMGRCKNTIGLNHKFSCECEDIPIFFVKISKSNQTAHKLNKTSWKPFCVLNLYWAFGSGVSCFFFA